MGNMQRTSIKPGGHMMHTSDIRLVGPRRRQGTLDPQCIGIKSPFTKAPNLVIHQVIRLGHAEGCLDANRHAIQVSWSRLGHVALAVDLFVVLVLLVVVVGPQGQFGAADEALEAALVEEGEVLQGADFVHLVDCLAASQAAVLVAVHGGRWVIS